MDRISLLSDDLIFKILSFVPSKVAVSTALLSKRWRYLWKHAPRLRYQDPSHDTAHWRASRFVDKFLLLNKAPVLETLHLLLGQKCPHTDVETWMSVAISRGVRDLCIFQIQSCSGPIRLPSNLYTCKTLVALHLRSQTTVVDVPSLVCFQSLKVLILELVKFSNNEMVDRLLSGCPVLEELRIVRGQKPFLLSTTTTNGVFNQLVSLDLCSCSLVWYRLILNHAPKLRVLRFEQKEEGRCCSSSVDVQSQWEQTSSVPTCLISSLETVKWIGYQGTQAEKEVVMYLLENSEQLKTMAITISTDEKGKLEMMQELSSTQRSSTECRLSFT